jgi:hypothetical protein
LKQKEKAFRKNLNLVKTTAILITSIKQFLLCKLIGIANTLISIAQETSNLMKLNINLIKIDNKLINLHIMHSQTDHLKDIMMKAISENHYKMIFKWFSKESRILIKKNKRSSRVRLTKKNAKY